MGEGANQKQFFTEENENVINEVGKVIILGSLTLVGFDRYGHTDTDTDMVIPIYSKPIPILPSRIYIKPIPIPISVLKFISNRYRYR